MKKYQINWFKVLMYYSLLIIHSNGFLLQKSNGTSKNLFPLSLIHISDFHARFEETNVFSLECKLNETCISGYARLVTVVKNLQQTRTNPIYLNAGDNFAGTLWFSIGKWNITQYFLNLLKADVMTVGNHEFDNGPEKLVPFLDATQYPIVLANVDLSDEPQLQGKFLNSTILTRGGRSIGVIGVVKSDIYEIANTGRIKFLDEIETVRSESKKLQNQGVNIIVVLSHCGIDTDLEIARALETNIDVIVGAHTHTFMYTGDPPGPDSPEYDYPVVIEQSNGHKTLIVHSSAFAKYVGDLTVYFNEFDEVAQWTGQPIFLGPDIQPDKEIQMHLAPWKKQFNDISQQIIGSTNVVLDQSNCKYAECIMGDFVTDAFFDFFRRNINDTKPSVAFIQAGGIRASLPKGPITFGDLVTIVPFGNNVGSFDLMGQYIWDAMEYSSSEINQVHTNLDHFLQISGMKLEVNATKPIGERVVSIHILCGACVPVQYEPIDLTKLYRVVTTDFVANGGNGYKLFQDHMQNYEIGEVDINVVIKYFRSIPKLESVDTGRIIVLT